MRLKGGLGSVGEPVLPLRKWGSEGLPWVHAEEDTAQRGKAGAERAESPRLGDAHSAWPDLLFFPLL